jgi:hypothetical protein
MNARMLAAILAGLVVGMVLQGIRQEPQAQAQGFGRPPRWEYKTVQRPDAPKEFEDILNQLGENRWEYCDVQELIQKQVGAPSVAVKTLVFKRAKP